MINLLLIFMKKSEALLTNFSVEGKMGSLSVLIVESNQALGRIWRRHMERAGNLVWLETDQLGAEQALASRRFDIVILNVLMRGGSAFSIADKVRLQCSETPVIFVSDTSFFSDGSVFAMSPNARAFVGCATPPEDLTALVEHYGRAS